MPQATPPPRPLIVRFGAMGDMVMMTTLVRALATRFGSPVDILSSGSWTQPLLAGQPGVGTVYLLSRRKLPYFLSREQQALAGLLKARGPGPVWYCDTDNRCLPLLRRAGLGANLVCTASTMPMIDNEHLVDYWQRFARRSPSADTSDTSNTIGSIDSIDGMVDAEPALVVPQAEQNLLTQWLGARGLAGRPLLLVQVGNKRTMRRGLRRRPSNTKWWPEANWAPVIHAMSRQHPEAAILMLGVPQEHGLNEEILALSAISNGVNLAGELPIPRLLALQSRACAMISVDTGPAHSAAAVGCPVVVLFGVADPARITPRGADAAVRHLVGRIDGAQSILGITVDQVQAAWEELPRRTNASADSISADSISADPAAADPASADPVSADTLPATQHLLGQARRGAGA
ncbi:MAG: glycosyltransferase family 9 protein [Lautropia sp.]